MNTEIAICIWLSGVIVSLPRLIASFYEIDENYIHVLPPSPIHLELLFSLFSWAAVLSGIFMYYQLEEKYFWKISKNSLWKRYNENKRLS